MHCDMRKMTPEFKPPRSGVADLTVYGLLRRRFKWLHATMRGRLDSVIRLVCTVHPANQSFPRSCHKMTKRAFCDSALRMEL